MFVVIVCFDFVGLVVVVIALTYGLFNNIVAVLFGWLFTISLSFNFFGYFVELFGLLVGLLDVLLAFVVDFDMFGLVYFVDCLFFVVLILYFVLY